MRASNLAFAMLALGIATEESWAQIPYRNYSPPSGPTLPYQLDYFRPQSGVLDQYNQFVAPKEALARQLGGIMQQQNYDFQAVEKQIRASDQVRESKAAATGTSAGFMNFSHYYGRTQGGAPSRGRRQYQPSSQSTPNLGLGFGS